MDMPLQPTWSDIAIRLALTMVAGGIVGFDRGVQGHAAGFRTTILVGLAASIAMIQANILLSTSGKTVESFVQIDVMRLPLGILTGVGFIGAGTIFKKGDLIAGVTTAATVADDRDRARAGWRPARARRGCHRTGRHDSGALKWVDYFIPRERRARLIVADDTQMRAVIELPVMTQEVGYQASFAEARRRDDGWIDCSFDISWRRAGRSSSPTELLMLIHRRYAVVAFALTTEDGR